MTKQITLEQALKLVTFSKCPIAHNWFVKTVHGSVYGDVVGGVYGDVWRDVYGCVSGYVGGSVGGTINGKPWQFIETPREKLRRLIEESGNEELLETLNQLEDNS